MLFITQALSVAREDAESYERFLMLTQCII